MNGRDVAIAIGVVIVAVLLFGLLGGGMMMGWGMMGYGGYGFNPLGWVLMLVFWALLLGGIALLAVWFFRQRTPAAFGPHREATALDILKERYARGEFTREQYEEMRREIER